MDGNIYIGWPVDHLEIAYLEPQTFTQGGLGHADQF